MRNTIHAPVTPTASPSRIPADLPETKVVAEIGCNHRGEVETARRLVDAAAFCGARYAKFQKRTPRELLTPEQYDAPYENPNSYGRTYGEHRERLELPIEVHARLKAYCAERGIGYATSVWDVTSAREVARMGCDYVKVPSACNNDARLLACLRDEFRGDVHVSLGMTTPEEERRIVDVFAAAPARLVLYACTSGYPVGMADVCLLEIQRLVETYLREGRCQAVGYSGHHLGIAVDMAAPILGATWIERHFTLDRTWKGTDHAASLEPSGLQKLVRDLGALRDAWRRKDGALLPVERPQREKLKHRPRAGA
jgi:N-acetylneuraminate synthase